MHRKHLLAAAATLASFGAAGVADAATFCVSSDPCRVGTSPKSTLASALNAAKALPGNDVVELGAGAFEVDGTWTYTGAAGNDVTITGKGDATLLRHVSGFGSAGALLTVQGGGASKVEDLRVEVPIAENGLHRPNGVLLENATAEDVEVFGRPDTEPAPHPTRGLPYAGFEIGAGGAVRRGDAHDIELGVLGAVPAGAAGEVTDSALTTPAGVQMQGGGLLTARRLLTHGQTGANAIRGELRIESSVLRLKNNGRGLNVAAYAHDATIRASHVTVDGDAPNTTGVWAASIDHNGEVWIDNSILDTAKSLWSLDFGSVGTSTSVTAVSSAYDAGTTLKSPGMVLTELGRVDLPNPLFTAGTFGLPLGSPLVDAGRSAVYVPGTADRLGNARVVDGNGDGVAKADLGAQELQQSRSQAPALIAAGRP